MRNHKRGISGSIRSSFVILCLPLNVGDFAFDWMSGLDVVLLPDILFLGHSSRGIRLEIASQGFGDSFI
jgi:hypothetical protein